MQQKDKIQVDLIHLFKILFFYLDFNFIQFFIILLALIQNLFTAWDDIPLCLKEIQSLLINCFANT